jgi:chromosome segregation ATPase
MPINSVQQAHDALLAFQPAGAAHDNCPLCTHGHVEQEVAHVADTTPLAPASNVYTEAQHFSLLKSAVESETSSLTAEKSELETRLEALESEKAAAATELSEAKTRIDVLEAEKATAEAAAESARTELAEFKTSIERSAQVEELKNSRKAAVQKANDSLADTFFSQERVTRWAEMAEEAFDALVADMTEMAKASPTSETKSSETKTTEVARESAAFAGGTTPSSESGESTLSQLLGGLRRSA